MSVGDSGNWEEFIPVTVLLWELVCMRILVIPVCLGVEIRELIFGGCVVAIVAVVLQHYCCFGTYG